LCESKKLAAGLPALEAGLQAWRSAGIGLMTPYYMGKLGLAKLRHHEAKPAARILNDAIALATRNDEGIYLAELYRLRAGARLVNGEAQDAIAADLERAVAIASALQQNVFAARARADLAEFGSLKRMIDQGAVTEPGERLSIDLLPTVTN
jgi:hypothetical protein